MTSSAPNNPYHGAWHLFRLGIANLFHLLANPLLLHFASAFTVPTFIDSIPLIMKKTLLLLSLLVSFLGQTFAAQPAFALKDNDTWVMAGDSITAQRLHTNYIEAFFRTRYPQLHLHFRNSGIGGNTTGAILARFDYDVAAWKPTIVSIELGMNDVCVQNSERPDSAAGYIAGMKKLTDNIRALKAQPLFISSSPIDDGSVMGSWFSQRCRTIHPFTEALKELGQKENVQVVDQYHPLIALWGPNKTLLEANALATRVRLLKPENNITGLKELQAFAKSWEGKPTAVSLGSDGVGVHPGPVGQYTMAATILAALGVDREVSSATLKPDGTVVAAKNCTITDIVSKDGKLAFTRLDERSPWPLSSDGILATTLMPEIADLSRYMLTVSGLPAGQYNVSMDGKPVATLSNMELSKGWNMSTLAQGSVAEREWKINAIINELQGGFLNQPGLNINWRAASKEKDQGKLAVAQKAIDECEAKLQAAIQPVPIHFEIAPAAK